MGKIRAMSPHEKENVPDRCILWAAMVFRAGVIPLRAEPRFSVEILGKIPQKGKKAALVINDTPLGRDSCPFPQFTRNLGPCAQN